MNERLIFPEQMYPTKELGDYLHFHILFSLLAMESNKEMHSFIYVCARFSKLPFFRKKERDIELSYYKNLKKVIGGSVCF